MRDGSGKIGSFFQSIWQWIRNFRSDWRNFLHFFLAFTGIFLILMAATLSVLRTGMYKITDQQITAMTKTPQTMAEFGLHEFSQNGQNINGTTGSSQALGAGARRFYGNDATAPGSQTGAIFNPMTYVVLYDSNGNVLNASSDQVAAEIQEKYKLDDYKDLIGHIGPVEVKSSNSNQSYSYRSTLVPVNLVIAATRQRIAYIQILQNVDQLQNSLASSTTTIIWTIVIFWVLSLFVAMYLSHWSLKPLQIALDRQKAFVSNASHELRTPIAILQNRLQLLFQKPDSTILDESENISASLNEVRNMTILTRNLLDMAKSDGRITVKPETTTQDYFKEIFQNYQLLADKKGKIFTHQLTFDKDEAIQVDQDLLKQALTIFFDNAVKYTRDEEGSISISVTKSGRELSAVIADNGPGVSDSNKKKIFDRFYRVDEARTRGKNGLGLGLSLAKEIVQSMKGTITVKDNTPTGVQFIIKLKV